MQAYDLSVLAAWFQFYVQDVEAKDDFSNGWTDKAIEALIICHEQAIAVGTVRNTDVPVRLEIHSANPPRIAGFDRQHEAELLLNSGMVQVLGCGDYEPDALVAAVPPGRYSVRISYFGLTTLSEDGLDGEDRYLVQLWLTPFS